MTKEEIEKALEEAKETIKGLEKQKENLSTAYVHYRDISNLQNNLLHSIVDFIGGKGSKTS